jgi:hypothetical protein
MLPGIAADAEIDAANRPGLRGALLRHRQRRRKHRQHHQGLQQLIEHVFPFSTLPINANSTASLTGQSRLPSRRHHARAGEIESSKSGELFRLA